MLLTFQITNFDTKILHTFGFLTSSVVTPSQYPVLLSHFLPKLSILNCLKLSILLSSLLSILTPLMPVFSLMALNNIYVNDFQNDIANSDLSSKSQMYVYLPSYFYWVVSCPDNLFSKSVPLITFLILVKGNSPVVQRKTTCHPWHLSWCHIQNTNTFSSPFEIYPDSISSIIITFVLGYHLLPWSLTLVTATFSLTLSLLFYFSKVLSVGQPECCIKNKQTKTQINNN